MSELGFCPICGRMPIVTRIDAGIRSRRVVIQCNSCGLTLDWNEEYYIQEFEDATGRVLKTGVIRINPSATEAWNRVARKNGGMNMPPEAITKLVELLRVFIRTPCRTKSDAELLEAKLAEFEREIAREEEKHGR